MQVGCQRGGHWALGIGDWGLGIRDLGLAGVLLLDELGFIPAIGLAVSLSLRYGAPEKLEAKTQKQEPKSKS